MSESSEPQAAPTPPPPGEAPYVIPVRYPPPPLPVRSFTTRADREDRVPARSPSRAHKIDLEDQRRAGRAAWQELRKHEGSAPESEEVRRRAREDRRKKYSDPK